MRLAFGRIAFPSFAKQNESTAFLTRLRGIRWPVLKNMALPPRRRDSDLSPVEAFRSWAIAVIAGLALGLVLSVLCSFLFGPPLWCLDCWRWL
jgi:hypothetical protein